jgi:hypothetical protein
MNEDMPTLGGEAVALATGDGERIEHPESLRARRPEAPGPQSYSFPPMMKPPLYQQGVYERGQERTYEILLQRTQSAEKRAEEAEKLAGEARAAAEKAAVVQPVPVVVTPVSQPDPAIRGQAYVWKQAQELGWAMLQAALPLIVIAAGTLRDDMSREELVAWAGALLVTLIRPVGGAILAAITKRA